MRDEPLNEPLTFITCDPETCTHITWKEVSKGIFKFEMNPHHWYELILHRYADNDDISDALATLYDVKIEFCSDIDHDNIVHELYRDSVDQGDVVYLTNLILNRYTQHLPKTITQNRR